MDKLVNALKIAIPDAIREVNEVRIPALEQAWGRSFKDELQNETQKTVEIAKNYTRVVNNAIYRHVKKQLPTYQEHLTSGSDYNYDGTLIEDKNSFSASSDWVGNGFNKTPVHLLKKFKCDENGRITAAFVALVDLSKCKAKWTDRKINTNRSTISFSSEDADHVKVAYGSLIINPSKLKPVLKEI